MQSGNNALGGVKRGREIQSVGAREEGSGLCSCYSTLTNYPAWMGPVGVLYKRDLQREVRGGQRERSKAKTED